MQNKILEAKKIIEGIRDHQLKSEGQLNNIHKKVNDLESAVRLIQESQDKPTVIVDKDESQLTQFIRKDGSLRLTKEKTSVVLKGYGVVNVEEKGILDTDKNYTNWHKDFKDICKKKSFLKMLCKHTPKTDAELFNHINKAPSSIKDVVLKSLYDNSGAGGDFVPDSFRESLYSEFSTPRELASMLEVVEVDRNQVLIPRLNFGGRPFKRGSVTSDAIDGNAYDASTPQTAQASISVSGFATRYRIDTDLIEDSALPLISVLSKQIYNDLLDAEEDCIINGDTRNYAVGQDTARNTWNIRSRWGGGTFNDGSDHRQVFDGLRRQARARSNNFTNIIDGNALTAAMIVEMMSKLGEHAAQDLMLITSPEYFVKEIMPLTQVLTMDQYGPAATIFSGSLASIFGMPIVLSRFMDIKLDDDGCYTSGADDKTGVLVVNRSSSKLYQRRGINVEMGKEVGSGAVELVSTLRRVMDSPDQAATKNVVFATKTQAI